MDVSIIIVNYNTKALLKQCIASVLEKTQDIEFEIIVVDNASSDGSQQMMKEVFPEIMLIESLENLGFGRANNLGIKYAAGKYLFLLNSDTILLNNAVKYFLDFMENNNPNNDIGVIGGVLWDIEHNPNGAFGYFSNISGTLLIVIRGYLGRIIKKLRSEPNIFSFLQKPFSYIEVDYVLGADMFLSTTLMRDIGGFDPCFFMYFEESDLQKRMYYRGLRRMIISGSQIVHLEGGGSNTQDLTMQKYIINDKSVFRYFKKHKLYISYFLFRTLYGILRFPIIFYKKYPIDERIMYVKNLFTRIILK